MIAAPLLHDGLPLLHSMPAFAYPSSSCCFPISCNSLLSTVQQQKDTTTAVGKLGSSALACTHIYAEALLGITIVYYLHGLMDD